jgi:shikimate dehydrogenase
VPLLDALTLRAERVGAVNTIVNRDGRLLGDNTDVAGFLRPLRDAGIRLRNRTAVVIGAGGAARSALFGLAGTGVGRVALANRHATRARRLARDLGDLGVEIEPLPLAALAGAGHLRDAALVVNATSIGWRGERFPALDYRATPRTCLFYDLVYGRRTDFLERARRAGRRGIDGSEMLLHQGASAFTLWTRRRAPLAAMRAALGKFQIDKPRGRR